MPAAPVPGSTLAVRLVTLLWAFRVLCFLAGLPILLDMTWLLLPAALLALPLARLWRRIWRPSCVRATFPA